MNMRYIIIREQRNTTNQDRIVDLVLLICSEIGEGSFSIMDSR